MSLTINYQHQPSKLSKDRAHALKVEIDLFNSEYCSALDHNEVEQWPEFFTEDAIYRITSRENVDLNMVVGLVYAEGKPMLHDRAVAISRTQMYAPRYLQHLVTNIRPIEEKDNLILAQANFILLQTLVEGPSTLHLTGSYYDIFERQADDSLLLKERQVIFDTSVLANDLVLPV